MSAAEITPAQRGQIDRLLDGFDFEQVHRAMVALKWKWHETDDGPHQVPATPDLRRCARKLLEYVIQPDSTGYTSTGGFVATRDEDGWINLRFEVARLGVGPGGEEDCL